MAVVAAIARIAKIQSMPLSNGRQKMDTLLSTLLVIIILAALVWGGGWLLLRRWSWGRWI
jgi:hypothetical protein